MTRWPTVLRALAIGIAIAAAVDPEITSNRIGRPEIAIVAVDAHHDSARAAQVARSLRGSFRVTAAAFAAADATVLVGDALPSDRSDLAVPVFAVTTDPTERGVTIEAVRAPARVPVESRVPVGVVLHTTGARGGEIALTLREFGVVVDRATSPIRSDDQRTELSLTFAPEADGIAALQLTAMILGNGARNDSAHADAQVEVESTPLPVLFYDPRPSWSSTFVRRAAQVDSRLAVTSRTVTSRNVSTAVGKAPAALGDLGALDAFDAIVVGAPDALTERDVAGLDAFMRRRGGSVVLLLDQPAAGPWRRLAGPDQWLDNGSGRMVAVVRERGDTALKASELAWPAALPPGADPLAFSLPPAGDTTTRHPVIWSAPVGSGQVIVSGALDSWRYRDSSVSGFDRFWRDLLMNAASASPPPVSVTLSRSVVEPGEPLDLFVHVRDAALHPLPVRTAVAARISTLLDRRLGSIRVWPDGSPGVLRGTVRAPDTEGTYSIGVDADGKHATAWLRVASGTTQPHPDGRDLLAAWTTSRGGTVLPAGRLNELPAALRRAIHPTPRPERWHPMRSLWWLIPFVLALSTEWWWRRRRGLS